MPNILKTTLKFVGFILSIAGVVFLLSKLNWEQIPQLAPQIGWLKITAAAFIYGAALLLLSYAWALYLGRSRDLFRALNKIYARSTLTKYIPSGIFQYASRQMDVIALGISQKSTAKASAAEILSQIAAASLIIALGFFIHPPTLHWESATLQHLAPYLFLVFLALSLACWGSVVYICGIRAMALCALMHIIFFAISGVIAATIAATLITTPVPFVTLISTLTLSWLAGFVVIGASGGIGIREAAIIFLLSGAATPATVAAIAILLRLITTAGDLIFYCASTLDSRKTIPYK